MTLDASQSAAVQLMLTARFALVTGPPGSGKTTTLRAALDELGPDVRVALAAPTGKAARRMSQATGRDASTLHRLLGYQGPGKWLATELAPLSFDAVYVDESSMIDYDLARALLAGAAGSRLVLIGDADQLPPVGAGRMFGDLVAIADRGFVPVARLTTQHRAAAESWVVRNAPAVLVGGPLELDPCAGFDYVNVESGLDVPAAVRGVIGAHGEAVVLAPQRTGPAGTEALNAELDGMLNRVNPARVPGEPTLKRDGVHVRRGMRVIQTRNDYGLDVMNGELGTVLDIDGDRGPVVVTFEDLGRVVTFARKESTALYPAYALTVHKTQGSEFPRVIVVCHSTHTHMLSRGILYTAITRAKQHVTIVGDARGIARALATPSDARNTTLIERIAGKLDALEGSAE